MHASSRNSLIKQKRRKESLGEIKPKANRADAHLDAQAQRYEHLVYAADVPQSVVRVITKGELNESFGKKSHVYIPLPLFPAPHLKKR